MTASVAGRSENTRGRWIPWAFVAFFLVVLAANATMILVGIWTWPGLATDQAYQRGLAYNRTLAAAEAQAALGWRIDFDFTQDGDRRGVLEVGPEDRFGRPLPDAEITAELVRPTHEGYDRVIAFDRPVNGRYRAGVELPLAGQWEVRVSVEERGRRYRLRERIYLQP